MAAVTLSAGQQVLVLITIIVFVSGLQDITLRKCCNDGEFLTINNTCTESNSTSEEHILYRFPAPLRHFGGDIVYNVDFPNICENDTSFYNDEYICIDKMLLSDIDVNSIIPIMPKFSIETKTCDNEFDYKKIVVNIKKCCSEHYYYEPQLHACQEGNSSLYFDMLVNLYTNEPTFVNIDHEFFSCSEVIVDYLDTNENITINGDSLFVGDEVYLNGSFCVDTTKDGTIVARVCRKLNETCAETICVRKCCPDGHSYQKLSTGPSRCLPTNKPFLPMFHTRSKEKIDTSNSSFAIAPGISHSKAKYFLDNTKYDEQHIIDRQGFVYMLASEKNYSLMSEYCLENATADFDLGLRTFLFFPEKVPPVPYHARSIYSVLIILSCLFLLTTLCVYGCLPDLRNLHGKTLMLHVGSLLIAYTCLAILNLQALLNESKRSTLPVLACNIIGYTLFHATLMSFSWLNIMCFDIWWTFGSTSANGLITKKREWCRFLTYCLYACGVPTLITAVALIVDKIDTVPHEFKTDIGGNRCFLNSQHYGFFIFFLVPIVIQTVCNLGLFIRTALYCSRIKSEIHRMQSGSKGKHQKSFVADRAIFFMNMKLFVVMGIPWIHELMAVYEKDHMIWVIGDICNSCVGIFIFIIFVCKRKVLKLLYQKIGFKKKSAHFYSTPKSNISSQSKSNKRMNSVSSFLITKTTSIS